MTKKIGILTLHRSINYGAFMQAYSLWYNLKKSTDYQIEIIDYDCLSTHRLYFKKTIFSKPFNFFSIYKRFIQYLIFKKSLKAFNLSNKTIINDRYDELFKYIDKEYDIVIVGSDIVWNWVARGLPNAYWLNYNFSSSLFSYAASIHGMNYDNIPDDKVNFCNEALARFNYIGVRDLVTEQFIRTISSDLKFHHNCDPTIMLDLKDIDVDLSSLKKRLSKKYNINFSKPIVGLMTPNKKIGKLARDMFSPEHQIISVYKENEYADIFVYDLNPFEWALIFSCFKITFTQYFHGTIFSLKNYIPVISIDVRKYKEKEKSKMYDVLKRLDMEKCFFMLDDINIDLTEKVKELSEGMIQNMDKEKIKSSLEKESCSFRDFVSEIKKIAGA